jgi:hypothetical protein
VQHTDYLSQLILFKSIGSAETPTPSALVPSLRHATTCSSKLVALSPPTYTVPMTLQNTNAEIAFSSTSQCSISEFTLPPSFIMYGVMTRRKRSGRHSVKMKRLIIWPRRVHEMMGISGLTSSSHTKDQKRIVKFSDWGGFGICILQTICSNRS